MSDNATGKADKQPRAAVDRPEPFPTVQGFFVLVVSAGSVSVSSTGQLA
jgi:hypothetical protein